MMLTRSLLWCCALLCQLANTIVSTPLDPSPVRPAKIVGLSPYVRYWEAARYEDRLAEGRRDKRGATTTTAPSPSHRTPLRFSFRAHNREFKLVLRPDPSSVFADDVEFHSTGGPLDYNVARVYSGTLDGDESSHVHGIITSDGLFDGTIRTATEEFYVEPLQRYNAKHPDLHSIIYRKSDVINPYNDVTMSCASQLLHDKLSSGHNDSIFRDYYNSTGKIRIKRWLPDEEMFSDGPKNPELPLDLDVPYTRIFEPTRTSSTRRPKTQIIDKSNLIIIKRNDDDDNNSRPKPKTHLDIMKPKTNIIHTKDVVKKEPVGFTVVSPTGNASDLELSRKRGADPKKTTCMLYLQADHMFYQRYGSEEACIEVMTRHVQKVNSIYKVTDFNQDGHSDNITFMIKRIKVHTMDALKDNSYRFPNNYGVEKYLELFSEEDYDAFCLAYMFTYRDFEMGTLGLAWTGDLKNAGGVCEKNGHYRGSMKSLNTGIVTLLNYGKHVPPAVSHVTLAHEIGHNFGSPHDPDGCTPGGEDGNYIMFARATSGDKRNNNKFSPCSLRSIDPVLNSKARSNKGCFTEPAPGICGNGVVEEGEECDCGWAADCTDACCRPQDVRPRYKPCTLTENSACSPSQGPCCTARCSLRFGAECRADNGCRDAAYCDGRSPVCPASTHKPNRTRCDKEFVCYMGECTGSICLAYGLDSCQCESRSDDPRSACELCCRAPPHGPCISSFKLPDVPDMYAKPGTPCNDYNGYCDVFQRCREVDPSGPLATLTKLLLSDESIANFKRWMYDYWYVVVIGIVGSILLLFGSSHWFNKRRNTKLSAVTVLHSPATETVRLPPDHVHTAVRTKLPLKKKVALRTRGHRSGKDSKATNKPDQSSPNHKKKSLKTKKTEESRTKIIKEETAVIASPDGKTKKLVIVKPKNKIKKRKNKLKKEVIDYSSAQKSGTENNDALTKVQKWLMNTPQPTVIPKSKSTPIGLTDRQHKGNKSPRKTTRNSKSSNNLNDKARLQVVFKPPFKFSVKLCKNDKAKAVLDKSSRPENDRRKSDPISNSADTKNQSKAKTNVPNKNALETKQTSATNTTNSNKSNPLPKSEEVDFSNVLTRSASDCKVTKAAEAKQLKKSQSIGLRKNIAESSLNLLSSDILAQEKDTTHFYENLRAPSLSELRGINKLTARQRSSVVAYDGSSKDDIPMKRPQGIKLRRQSSENEISARNKRKVDLCLPLSAGTQPSNVDLEGFKWSINKNRLSIEPSKRQKNDTRMVSERKSKNTKRHSINKSQTFGELKNTVPDFSGDAATSPLIKSDDLINILDIDK